MLLSFEDSLSVSLHMWFANIFFKFYALSFHPLDNIFTEQVFTFDEVPIYQFLFFFFFFWIVFGVLSKNAWLIPITKIIYVSF